MAQSDTCGCTPSESILFGPGRGHSTTSAAFTVGKRPRIVRLYDSSGDAKVQLFTRSSVCDEVYTAEAKNGCDDIELDSCNNTVLLFLPGEYFAVVTGVDPEDIILEHLPVDTAVTLATQGATNMNCVKVDYACDPETGIVTLMGGSSGPCFIQPGSRVSVVQTGDTTLITVDGETYVLGGAAAASLTDNGNGTYTFTGDSGSVTFYGAAPVPASTTQAGVVQLVPGSSYPATGDTRAVTPNYVAAALAGISAGDAVSALTFDPTTSIITLEMDSGATFTANLSALEPDGNLSGASFDSGTSTLTLTTTDGGSFDVDLSALAGGGGGSDGNITGVSFDSTTNVLTITSSVGGPYTASLGSLAGGGGGGATNLGYTPGPTDGTVTSSTGTSATVPLATTVNAGLAPRRSGSATQFLNGAGVYSAIQTATASAQGIVELATTAEATAGTDTTLAVTPAGVKAAIDAIPAVPVATTSVQGKVELATVAEATAGTDTTLAVTPAGVKAAIDAIPDATTTVRGEVMLATVAEAVAGTNTTDAVTPDGLKAALDAFTPDVPGLTDIGSSVFAQIVSSVLTGQPAPAGAVLAPGDIVAGNLIRFTSAAPAGFDQGGSKIMPTILLGPVVGTAAQQWRCHGQGGKLGTFNTPGEGYTMWGTICTFVRVS